MRRFTCAFAAVVFAACHVLAGGDDAKNLQGTWDVAELIVGGKAVPAKSIQGLRFQFKGDKLTILPTSLPDLNDFQSSASGATGPTLLSLLTPVSVDKREFIFKIDPAKKPATVDLTPLDGKHKGVTSPGIYELKGDVLRWCQSDDEKAKDRPKEFKSPDKSAIYLFTLKRAKGK